MELPCARASSNPRPPEQRVIKIRGFPASLRLASDSTGQSFLDQLRWAYPFHKCGSRDTWLQHSSPTCSNRRLCEELKHARCKGQHPTRQQGFVSSTNSKPAEKHRRPPIKSTAPVEHHCSKLPQLTRVGSSDPINDISSIVVGHLLLERSVQVTVISHNSDIDNHGLVLIVTPAVYPRKGSR